MKYQRKHYLIFFLNPTWRPNHVTYHFEINKLASHTCHEYSSEISPSLDQRFWRRCLKVLGFFQDGRQTMWRINNKLTNLKEDLRENVRVKFHLNLHSRSGEEDFFKKNTKKQDGGRITSLMTSKYFFSTMNFCVDDAQEISNFCHVAFYLTNFYWDTSSLMTSRKITRIPERELVQMYQAKFFYTRRFPRYRGPKLICFFKMAPVSRDLWRHNYQLCMLSKKIHIWWKFCVDWSYHFWENGI